MLGASDWLLWSLSWAALASTVLLLGGRKAAPVLVWVVAFVWLQVAGDLVSAELHRQRIADGPLGQYQTKAIFYSLCAIVALAAGMRVGLWGGVAAFGRGPPKVQSRADGAGVSLNRAVFGYFVTLLLLQGLGTVARAIPPLQQLILAFGLIRYVFIYLISATVAENRRGYVWLMLIILLEVSMGVVSYFSSYKEAIFVMLIAFASQARRIALRQYVIAAAATVVVIWMSLVWSNIKQEYRTTVIEWPLDQRVAWLRDQYFSKDMDYFKASQKLFERVGYTKFYSIIVLRAEQGSLPPPENYYGHAVLHVVTPRLLFPDKQALNDSAKTSQLLGIRIGEKTSIGIGYIVQAHVDFGFPGALGAVGAVGALIGMAAQYFLSRNAALITRQAFLTAAIFLSFPYAANIDKALGGFIISVVAMGLALRYGYPRLAPWLAGGAALDVVPPARRVSRARP